MRTITYNDEATSYGAGAIISLGTRFLPSSENVVTSLDSWQNQNGVNKQPGHTLPGTASLWVSLYPCPNLYLNLNLKLMSVPKHG
jgi:hypothetical protein